MGQSRGKGKTPALALGTRIAQAGTSHAGAPGAAGAAFAPLGPSGETSHAVPLYQVSNFSYPDARGADAAAEGRAYLYGRHGTPTVAALEAAMAGLEGADAGLAFASGMAAIASATLACAAGGEVLLSEGIYGGSTELVTGLGPRLGITARTVPAWDSEAVAAAIGPETRVLLVETVSNPLLRVADLPTLGRLARKRKIALVVDATASSPLLCRPLGLGATLVVHSLSKYVGGHGDLIGGIALGGAALIKELHRHRTLLGAVIDPFCAWLALRGLRTMAVRMERQCETAGRLAAVLAKHPAVRAVHYPGLRSHPDYARAGRTLARPGALISFELRSGAAARKFYDRVRVVTRAASFGEVTSLLTHPATFSHKGLGRPERERLGIRDGLLRLSVGIEDSADLEADIRQALER